MNNDTHTIVRADGISKSFIMNGSSIDVLKNIQLEVATGEMLCIMGASGVGKSTLLHILGMLDLPTSGSLWVAGAESAILNATQRALFRNKTIGFVFQFHHLLPEFTALENVMLPLLISRIGRKQALEQASEMLDEVGLSARLHHMPSELSGGEQQRVAIARALVNNPRILLADEPTGNLDQATSLTIYTMLVQINKQRNLTCILVTHNPELARRCDRTVTMVDGQILN